MQTGRISTFGGVLGMLKGRLDHEHVKWVSFFFHAFGRRGWGWGWGWEALMSYVGWSRISWNGLSE